MQGGLKDGSEGLGEVGKVPEKSRIASHYEDADKQ